MGRLVKVCEVSELPPGTMRAVDVDETRILVVNFGGRFYAVDGICTHETADLSLGFLNENKVTCPLHLSQFDVTTGAVLNPPATEPLRTFNVRVEGASIFVEVG